VALPVSTIPENSANPWPTFNPLLSLTREQLRQQKAIFDTLEMILLFLTPPACRVFPLCFPLASEKCLGFPVTLCTVGFSVEFPAFLQQRMPHT
jgi:hypothetical protein